MFVKYGREYANHLSKTGPSPRKLTAVHKVQVDAMYQAVLNAGWDGDWFLRAYDANSPKGWFP